MDRREFQFLKVIQKIELFRTLDSEEARHVLNLCKCRNFEPNEVVWQPHEESTDMLILITGKLIVQNQQGSQIAEVLPGALFGEMGCLTEHPRFVGITSTEASIALSLNRGRLRRLATEGPQLYIKILENAVDVLSHRLTNTEHDPHRGNRATKRDISRW